MKPFEHDSFADLYAKSEYLRMLAEVATAGGVMDNNLAADISIMLSMINNQLLEKFGHSGIKKIHEAAFAERRILS